MKQPCHILGHLWESAMVSGDQSRIVQICRRCGKSRVIKAENGQEVQRGGEAA